MFIDNVINRVSDNDNWTIVQNAATPVAFSCSSVAAGGRPRAQRYAVAPVTVGKCRSTNSLIGVLVDPRGACTCKQSSCQTGSGTHATKLSTSAADALVNVA